MPKSAIDGVLRAPYDLHRQDVVAFYVAYLVPAGAAPLLRDEPPAPGCE